MAVTVTTNKIWKEFGADVLEDENKEDIDILEDLRRRIKNRRKHSKYIMDVYSITDSGGCSLFVVISIYL